MNTRGYDRRKTPQSSAFAPVSNRLQSRPFAPQAEAQESSPQQQETPDLQKQLEKEQRFGYNFSRVSVVAPSPSPADSSTGSWLQPRLERNEPGIVDTSQTENPLLQRMIADIQQPQPASKGGRVKPIVESIRQNFHAQPQLAISQSGNKYEPSELGTVQRLCDKCALELNQDEEKQPIQAKLALGQPGNNYKQEADSVAAFVVDKINDSPAPKPIQRQSELEAKPELNISIERSASVIRRLTSEQFRTQLGSTPEQKAAIDTLFANPTFLALWNYLKNCQATPQQDLGPLRLKVTPGLRISGVERFGGYNSLTKTLEINPTKAEHVSNPTELVDTIVHEMIHAVDDLQADCVQAGSPPAPLQGAATQTAPSRADVAGTPDEARLMTELGPGASNPCEEFIDINAAAQQMIVQILTENIQVSHVGRPTLTFVNVILRRNPAAMSEYEACRGKACALPDQNARRRAIARCSAEIIGKYIPPDLLPSLLPTRIYFDFGAQRLRSDSVETLDLVGLFLLSHPNTSVNLTGHADPVGSEAVNLKMGQLRAEAVAQQLIRKGVDPKQILSVTSQGEANPLSTSRDTHWKDRRVEVVPS